MMALRLTLTRGLRSRLLGVAAVLLATAASAADTPLPFEGTWVRADRACTPAAAARTYTARSLASTGGRCTIRKIAFGMGEYELFEDCHRAERSGFVTEKIRMLGPDALILKFQANRLKIPRGRKFLRCTIAAAKPPVAVPGRLPIVPGPKAGPATSTSASPAPAPAVHDPD